MIHPAIIIGILDFDKEFCANYFSQLFVKHRFQFREKRKYVDSHDNRAISKLFNEPYTSFQAIRVIRDVDESECKQYHDMFAKEIDDYKAMIDECPLPET